MKTQLGCKCGTFQHWYGQPGMISLAPLRHVMCRRFLSALPHSQVTPQLSLGPRPKTNPSADHFQLMLYILEVIYAPNEVWGRDYPSYKIKSESDLELRLP